MPPLLIIADHYRLAVTFAQDHGLGREGRESWRYIPGERQAFGRYGPGRFVVVAIGEVWGADARDRFAAARYLRAQGFTEVSPRDLRR